MTDTTDGKRRLLPKWLSTAVVCGFIGVGLGCGDEFSWSLASIGVVGGFLIGAWLGLREERRKSESRAA